MIHERTRSANFPYDFATYDRQGRLSALLEAKRRFGRDASWAREWHTTVLERMQRPVDVPIVLVMPDRVYAWRPGRDANAAPDWDLDAEPLLGPYFKRLKILATEVDPHVFEEIVGIWLRDIVEGGPLQGSGIADPSSLLEGLRGCEVVRQFAA